MLHHEYSKKEVRGQGHSDQKIVRGTPSSQDASHTNFGIPTYKKKGDMHWA